MSSSVVKMNSWGTCPLSSTIPRQPQVFFHSIPLSFQDDFTRFTVDGDDKGIMPSRYQADSRKALHGESIVKEGNVEYQWTASEAMALVNTDMRPRKPSIGKVQTSAGILRERVPRGTPQAQVSSIALRTDSTTGANWIREHELREAVACGVTSP